MTSSTSPEDEVQIIGEKKALPIEKRNIPKISDIARTFTWHPNRLLQYKGFELTLRKDPLFQVTSRDKTLLELYEETKRKRKAEDKIKSEPLKALLDFKTELEENHRQANESYEQMFGLSCFNFKRPRFSTSRFLPKFPTFRKLHKELPVVEDVPLLRPPIVYKCPELTDYMMEANMNALRMPIIRDKPYTLKPHDLKTLMNNAWLNDVIMDAYMMLIEQRAKANKQNVRCFTTFLFTRLLSGGVNDRFMKKEDFLSYDLVIFPINLHSHWRLMAIDVLNKRISYYDSLGWNIEGADDIIFNFLSSRCEKQRNQKMDINEWSYISSFDDIPRQDNTYDCGVFALKYADCLAQNIPFFFEQKDMPMLRKTMSYELITATLL